MAPDDPTKARIRLARMEDANAFAEHVAEYCSHSGREGAVDYALSRHPVAEEIATQALSRWHRPLTEPLWGRTWLLVRQRRQAPAMPGVVPKDSIVGHLDLRGGRVHEELHRATLGMGLLPTVRRLGHGRRLMGQAIAWARDVAGLSWLDLGVFAINTPARGLYAHVGFKQTGVHTDAFRLQNGARVDDVHMSLALRAL